MSVWIHQFNLYHIAYLWHIYIYSLKTYCSVFEDRKNYTDDVELSKTHTYDALGVGLNNNI